MKRREFVSMLGPALVAPRAWAAPASTLVEVWKSDSCGCGEWIKHLPASDIRRLLAEKPKAIGLTAPGMPQGSPGMDVPDSPPYEVLLVRDDKSTALFAQHVPGKGAAKKDSVSCPATPDPKATGCGKT